MIMSNADQHGPTCAETPTDHRCGDTEMDQGVTWKEDSQAWSLRVKAIADLHQQGQELGGAVSGYCSECSIQWPCATYHIAAGWGEESFVECEESGWCAHAEVKYYGNQRPVALAPGETENGGEG